MYYLCSSLSLREKQVFTFPKISLLSVKWNFSSCSFPTWSSKQSLTIPMTTPTCIFLANKSMRNLMAVGTQHHPRRLESSSPFFCIWDWCVWGAMNSTGIQPACTMVSRAEAFYKAQVQGSARIFCMWTPPTMIPHIVTAKFVWSMTKSVPPPHNSGSRSSTFR